MLSEPDEALLATAAANGDGEAFARLYDSYEGRIFNYCLRLLGSRQDAEDATQDAFLKVLRRLPDVTEREINFGAYLFTAARNTSYDMIDKRKRTQPVDEIPEHGPAPVFGDGPALDEDPVRAAMLAAQQDSVRAANSRLPARQREVLALREIEEMSYEDIAAIMEMNANSVAQLISRARIRLRGELHGVAAAEFTPAGPDCDRALPLLAMSQDGQLGSDDEDATWLNSHLNRCDTCRLAAESVSEAGASYRAWAPLLPAIYLFRDTMAKASSLTGSDWSGVERPSGSEQTTPGSQAASADGSAGGSGGLPKRPGRRRILTVAALTAILVLGMGTAVVVGGFNPGTADESPVPAGSEPTATIPLPTTEETQGNPATAAKGAAKKSRAKRDTPLAATTQTADPQSSFAPAPAPVTAVAPEQSSPTDAQPTPKPTRRRPRPAQIDSSLAPGDRPARPTPDPDPEPAPAPEPVPEQPPAPEPEPPEVPPEDPRDPPPTPGGPNCTTVRC